MARVDNLENFLTDVAGAIKTKKGTTDKIPATNFDTEIASIETGIDTSDATATANDIISPKTAYVNGEKITGNIITETKQEGTIAYKNLVSNSIFSDYNYNNSINSDNLLAIAKNATIYIYQINTDGTLTEQCTYTDNNNYTVTTVLLTDGVAVNDTKHYLLIYSTVFDGSTYYEVPYHMFKELVKKADGTYEVIDTAIQGTKDDGFDNGPFFVNVVAKKSRNIFIVAEIGGGNSSSLFTYIITPDTNGNFSSNKVRTEAYGARSGNITYDFRFLNTANPILYYRASKFGNNCIINFTPAGNVASVYSFTPTVSDMNLFSICYDEDTEKFIECEKVNNTISFYELSLNNNVLTKGNSLGTINDTSANKIVLEYYKKYFILKCINGIRLSKTVMTCEIVNGKITVKNSFLQSIRSAGYYNAMTTNPYGRIDQNYTYNSDFLVTGTNNSYVGTLNADNITTTKAIIGNDTLLNTVEATAGASNILVGKTAYADNVKITGTMPNNGELNYTPSTEEQTIPAGYTSGGTIAPMDITTSEEYNTCLGLTNQIIGNGGNRPEYTQLTYIQANGTQWLDTGYTPNDNTKIIVELSDIVKPDETAMFGANTTWDEYSYLLYCHSGMRWTYNGPIIVTSDLTSKHTITMYRGTVILDGSTVSTDTQINSSAVNSTLTLFSIPGGQHRGSYKLYSFKIYENGVLIKNYIPVKDALNVVCLYDTINKQYIYNQGTNEFISGEEAK